MIPEKPKILVILNRLVIGGHTSDTIPLLFLFQQEYDLLVLYGCPEPDEAEALFLLEKYPGLSLKKIHSLKKRIHFIRDLQAIYSIYKIIRSFKPDLVHTHGTKAGFTGRIAARLAKNPVVFHTFHGHVFHSYYNRYITGFLIYTERMLARITDTVIAISDKQKQELVHRYRIAPEEKIKVVPLGIDTELYLHGALTGRKAFRQRYGLTAGELAIGMIGRIVRVKNFEMFIRCILKILEIHPTGVRFFIIGNGHYKPHLQKMLTKGSVKWSESNNFEAGSKVIFTSWIENLEEQIHGLDIIALTSLNEGTPLSLLEAQVCSKPVVATNVGGVQDIILEGMTGILTEPGDVEHFTKGLLLLIENEQVRDKMGRKAGIFAAENFSKQQELAALGNLYRTAIRKGS